MTITPAIAAPIRTKNQSEQSYQSYAFPTRDLPLPRKFQCRRRKIWDKGKREFKLILPEPRVVYSTFLYNISYTDTIFYSLHLQPGPSPTLLENAESFCSILYSIQNSCCQLSCRPSSNAVYFSSVILALKIPAAAATALALRYLTITFSELKWTIGKFMLNSANPG